MTNGCPTRRGLSPFIGPDVAHVKWTFPLAGPSSFGPIVLLLDAAGAVWVGGPLESINPDGSLAKTFSTMGYGGGAFGVDGTLYLPTQAGLSALNPATGVVKWSAGAQSDQGGPAVIAGDGSIVYTSGASLVAVTPAGAVKWSTTFGNFDLNTAPAVAPDGTLYLVTVAGLVAVHADGSVAWTKPLQGYGGGTPAIGHDGTVFIGNGSHVHAFAPDGSARWDVDLVDPLHMDSIAVGPDGSLFAGGALGGGSVLYHLSPADGSVLWQLAVPSATESVRAVVDAAGRVYATLGGFVYALRCDGSQMWTFTTSGCEDLVIGGDGRLYVSGPNAVYALGP